MQTESKRAAKWNLKKTVILILAVLLIAICAAGILFSDELKIVNSIKRVESEKPAFFMQVDGDYHFEEFLATGGASSDQGVSAFISNKISKGFYTMEIEEDGVACSTIYAKDPDGAYVWARNFDWDGSVPIIVKSDPKDGYSSISTCEFKNITGDAGTYPDGIANKMLAIAALYVPMDGINEAGLCVADLQVNEGGMATIATDKPDLTITTAIRLLLNKAATVDEAIELLNKYDIYPSGGISHHLSIADKTGKSVVVEFIDGNLVVMDTNSVTNFNLANGDTAAGGESAQRRYEHLSATCSQNGGILTVEQVTTAISEVAQLSGESTTQWSIVYKQGDPTATYYFDADFAKPYSYAIGD